MPNLDLKTVPQINIQNLSFDDINILLENAYGQTSFTGKRYIIVSNPIPSLKNRSEPFKKIYIENLIKDLANKLYQYPIYPDIKIDEIPWYDRFSLAPKQILSFYKKNINSASEILTKIVDLDKAFKKEIKTKNIITRIFFFFTQFFETFSLNLKNANIRLLKHIEFISKKEELLKPFSTYHKVSNYFNFITLPILLSFNLIFQLFNINIPYITKFFNIMTATTIFIKHNTRVVY